MEIQSFEEWSASRRPQAYMEYDRETLSALVQETNE